MKLALSVMLCLMLLLSNPAVAAHAQETRSLDKVKLQLKWQHQFQFAGYYAAKEQGYYAKEGLDVEIFERANNKDLVEQVVSGDMDFAVGDSGILSYYARGEPIVALAAIFQHNPLVFIAKQSSGIISPYEMRGKKVMFDVVGAGDSPLRAVLMEAGLKDNKYKAIPHTFRNDDLIEDKIDVMSAYLSDEIFYFQEKKLKINIINPQSYGIDFYGDMLFTSQKQLENSPDRVQKFRDASLKGWQYALDHPEEIIQLIHKKYHSKLSLDNLRFEAEVTRKLIMPDVITLGKIELRRLKKVAEVYAELELSQPLSEDRLAKFISPFSRENDKPLIVGSEENYPPFALGKSDATADGFTVELWRAVSTEQHLSSNIRVLPFHDVLQQFKAGKIDVLINLAQSDERRQFADFTVPHMIVNGAVFVRDDENSIQSEADLAHKKIIVLNADLAHDYAVSKGWAKQLELVDTIEQGFQLLSEGRYDALLVSKLTGKQTLEKLKINNIKMLMIKVGFSQKFSFAVHKGNDELLAKINEGLAMAKANGVYEKLHEKWFGVYEEKALQPLLVKYLSPIIALFLLILTGIVYRRSVDKKCAAQRLQNSEIRYRNTFEYAPIGIVNISMDGHFLAANQTYCDILGYSRAELLTMTVLDVTQQDDKTAYQQIIAKLLTDEVSTLCIEKQFLRKNRTLVWGSLCLRLSRHPDGSPDYLIATVEDINTSKQIQHEIIATRNQLQITLDAIPDVLFEVDLDGRYMSYHTPHTEQLTIQPTEIVGKTIAEILPPDAACVCLAALQEAHQDNFSTGKVFQLQFPEGAHWFELSVAQKPTDDIQQPHFIMLSRDITERKQMEAALFAAKQTAEMANRAKSEFLANMSHEIRTPMNAVLGFSDILSSLITDKTQRYYLDAIHRSGKTLLQLINDILDLSKIEAGKLVLQYRPVSIRNLLEDVYIVFSQKAANKSLDFSLLIDEKLPNTLLLDEIRLRQVLLNLLGNAFKFTECGFVKIVVSVNFNECEDSLNLEIAVSDSGIGIPKAQQEKIFAAFTQQDHQSIEYGGTGLGLTICKRLMSLMQGCIKVESDEGKGSCFSLSLNHIKIVESEFKAPQKAVQSTDLTIKFQPAQILLIDDLMINRLLIRSYLTEFTELGITEAETGAQALLLLEKPFDLILIDRRLPDINGDELCQKIKLLPHCATVPIIMVSASVLSLDEIKQPPFYDLQLNKPVKKAELITAMQSFLPLENNAFNIENETKIDAAKQSVDWEKLPELLALLTSEYREKIKKLSDSAVLEIDTFIKTAEELIAIADTHHCEPLSEWASLLKSQAELFELEKLPKTLAEFEVLLRTKLEN